MALVVYRIAFWICLILVGILLLLIAKKLHLRWWPAWILRMLMVALILMGIFVPRSEALNRVVPEREVMILDLSDSLLDSSLESALGTAKDWQRQSTERMLLAYGHQALVTYPEENSLPEVDGRANSLGEALALADTMLGTTPGRVILASDGLVPQSDDVNRAFHSLINHGHMIDWLPLKARDFSSDGYLGQLWAPRNLWQGMPFYVVVPVFAPVPMDEIKFVLTVNGSNLETTQRTLGDNYIEFLVPPQAEGITTLEVFADIPSDTNHENNASFLTVQVHKEPRVLFVSEATSSPQVLALLESMSHKGIDINQITPAELPTSLDELSNFQVILLNNFLANELTQEQMLTLRVFVSKLGGGLVFLGGRNSYTLGGYKNTLLEPILPVKLEPPSRPERPPMVFLLVLDHSGSMDIVAKDGNKPIDLAREAAMRAMENLQANDYLGVLTFNAEFDWEVPLNQLDSGLALRNALDAVSRIKADGGTKMFAALEEALVQVDSLPETASKTISILLLSDGESDDGNIDSFSDLAKTANAEGINISTIAFGQDANEEIMQAIATYGKGRYYRVLWPDDLPKVMVRESEAIRGENIQEGETNLVMNSDNPDHPILTGLSMNYLPNISGYNALTSKSEEGAEDVLMSANFGDPILSVWQYGLGRVVSWMTDSGEEWAQGWLVEEAQGVFWSQVVRYALPQPGLEPANVDVTVGDTDLTIEATIMDDVTPEVDRLLNLAEVKFSYTGKDGEIHTQILPQTAPGRYLLVIPRPEPGAYRAVLEYASAKGEKHLIPVLFEVNTPQEWLPIQQDENSIVNINKQVTETGGKLVTIDSLENSANQIEDNAEQEDMIEIEWWWYIPLALIIYWPVEIAIRRRWLPWM